MNKPQILIIEDDNAIGNLISTTLETQHYQYRRAKNGASGVLEAASCRPDVILLDLGLPDMDGVDIIKKVRTWSNTPIIVISARSEDHDKVEALDAGADDYLTKPFSVEELLARLRVSLRRVRYDSEKVDEAASIYQNGGLKIDYAAGCTYQNGKEIHLTPIEYIRNCLKRVRKKESAMLLASQNLEDFDQEGVREMTKPLFSIPPHQFLFNAGTIDKRFYMDLLQLEPEEYELIRQSQRGICLYKCGNERYLLEVHAPSYKEKLFGAAGGR